MGRQHETKAIRFVPKMYDALVKGEGLTPSDAADRIYKDLVGIWQKDTIRRLLPPESKNQVAREMQALSRFTLESTGSVLRNAESRDDTLGHQANGGAIATQLEEENATLRKKVEELESTKKALMESVLRLERSLAEETKQRGNENGIAKMEEGAIIVFPPHLFMKTYALMRGSTKPLALKIIAKEAVDIDRMKG